MQDFDYGKAAGETIAWTGVNGFLHPKSRKVIFCARMGHMDLVQRHGLTGVPGGYRMYDPAEEGGAKWGRRDAGLAEIYFWVAYHGWCHFVSIEKDGQRILEAAVVDDGQTKVMKEFATLWKMTFVAKWDDIDAREGLRPFYRKDDPHAAA